MQKGVIISFSWLSLFSSGKIVRIEINAIVELVVNVVHVHTDAIFAQIARRSLNQLVIRFAKSDKIFSVRFQQQILIGIYLSSDGSLLNISFGTVAGASGTRPMRDCLDCKWRSTSSAVMCPSFDLFVCVMLLLFTPFFAAVFFRLVGTAPLPCDALPASAFRFFAVSIRFSSSDDSVSSLSDDEFSGFSYWSKRSNRNERSRVTLSSRRWLDRSASWKNSFSYGEIQSITSPESRE